MRLIGIALISILGLGACSEKASSGAFVSIPKVGIACTTTRCKASASGNAYITYTTSSCTNPSFGETVTGNAVVTCNAGTGCTGLVTTFSDTKGTATSMASGTYSICVTIDYNGNYAGSATSGDSSGSLQDTSVSATSSTTLSVTNFTDIP